ncbi:ATP-binding protein [Pelagicoccus sp. SDUM812002]|uniref:ATP-binding protein n=1 Tax=Pelagicoccus sp. SDUM812002 TaxID=3041266 RepID=UPI00280C5622|nr:ATP-binding protein [Pelagicoccus sp. SDUM812002]MDQ8186587.1 ATP-binding protein [Pelagicoccus sp. SDUM812002]
MSEPRKSGWSEEELRERFIDYNKSFRIANSRVGCLLVVFLMPFGALLDYFVYPDQLGFFFQLRVLCSAIVFGIWWSLGQAFGKRYYRLFGLLWYTQPSLFIALMIYYTEGVYSPYYAGLNLVLIGLAWVAQVDFVESLVSVLLTLVMYGAACYFHGDSSLSLLINNLYFIVLTGVIVVTGSFFLNRMRYREFGLRHELDANREELEASNLKLVEMDKAKTNFFANISHELRTPLTLLIGPLDRMRRPGKDFSEEEREELLDIMQQNAMRLMRLINDLLNLVRLDAGSLKLRPASVELVAYLEGVCRSFYPMAQERSLDFSWEIEAGADKTVNLDREKVEKILLNLLFNAIKFTPPGGRIVLRARREANLLRIEVIDTGKGIAPEELASVFDRFWQSETASNRRYQGVGIGLALVRDLAQLHGGGVSAQSVLGEGTTMQVDLDVSVPLEPVTPEAPDSNEGVNTKWLEQLYRRADFFPSHAKSSNGADTSARSEGAVVRGEGPEEDELPGILVADDEPEMMRFLRSQLRGRYRIDEARDGAEALKIAAERRHHLILLDFMMPRVDGIEATRRLREMPSHRGVPIVILTARADEESKFQALDAGATDFLTKPFSSTELLARCRNLASVYEMQQQVEDRTVRLEEALELIKQTETQMVQQAKMASLGQLSAGLLHEVNNPLNFATTSIHLIKKRLSRSPHPEPDLLEKPLADLHDGIRRVSEIVSSLREFTHPDTKRFDKVDLNAALENAIRFVQIPVSEISLKKDLQGAALIRGNQNQLVHLFINLLQNSVDSLREKGAEKREMNVSCQVDSERVHISFEDNGMGIEKEALARIFDAFFTTKKVGQGVGLGLSICHRIIQQHQGTVFVESEAGQWCRFSMTFPAYSTTQKTVSDSK